MSTMINVLVVDDEAYMMEVVAWMAKKSGVNMSRASTRVEMEKFLGESSFDAILMDGNLSGWGTTHEPNFPGAWVVHELRGRGITTKIFMFSSDEERLAEGIALGANGVFSKRKSDWKELVQLVKS
jgi:CheY-like chemotaxis protein